MLLNLLISLSSIYAFILAGFLLKKSFKEKINDYTLTLLSIYTLSPIMVFWGFMLKPIDRELLMSPVVFLGISLVAFGVLLFFARFFTDRQERSIATAAPLIGNTGNIGIPLCIMLLGDASVPYTNAINLVNIFLVYILGVFFYSLGTYTIKDSLFNILKMPVIWSALFAIVLNLTGVTLPANVMKALEMGAYSSMAIQLILFGTFLYSAKLRSFSRRLFLSVLGMKFLLIPFIAFFTLLYLDLGKLISGVIFIELAVPLAITNATLATLYNCKPQEVTAQIFYSTLFFVPYSILVFWILERFF